jgi:hypothetical protein
VGVADWTTVSSLATGAGTLVLAVATFASVRSANRAARVAERSLLAGLRPLLVPSQLHDTELKVFWGDGKTALIPGSGAVAEAQNDVVYLAASLRNVGTGICVLRGWLFYPEDHRTAEPPSLAGFTRQERDLYIAAGDVGFWQGAFRDPDAASYVPAMKAVTEREPLTVDLLYGDYEGGQRVISRFLLRPVREGRWICSVTRHWNVDRPDPR